MRKLRSPTQPPKQNSSELQEELQSLINSCHEGFTGEWDCNAGKEGFEYMAISLEKIAKLLNIKVNLPEFTEEE